ncbi:MAG TPA: signal recognition particle protein [Candidatus Xenobia bacterium]|jgi:signal recognition particle subunit SRP54
MLDSLSDRLGEIFNKLRSRGKLSEQDVTEALREVRRALLEADVSLKVVQQFVAKVKAKAIGEAVWQSLTPGQLVIKFVRDELVDLMGGANEKIQMASQPPTILMLTGLHGAGKTTTAGKLALYLRGQGRKPMMVAADVYRPAAITQLQVLGKQLDIPVYAETDHQDAVRICQNAVEAAHRQARDVLILDTAGRLHVDDALMGELQQVKSTVKPHEVLLVVDAMTGQDAVNIAEQFNQKVGVDGVILTKMDGDARGGAALSVKAVTGKPIKFVGMGEKLAALEAFHPDRLVSRILGMGDVLTLIEKAETAISQEEAEQMVEKFRTNEFDLEDFLDTIGQIKKMGPLGDLISALPIPGLAKEMKDNFDPRAVNRLEAIIQSMTPLERRNPKILNARRKIRVATGSGSKVEDVNRLLKQFDSMKHIMRFFTKKSKGKRGMRLPFLGN